MSRTETLAIDGGAPAVTSGPFDWPAPDDEVRDALEAAYRDGDWGRYEGRRCARLREELSQTCGARFVQLTCSGTFAVELALRALGVSAGEEVLLAGYDFSGNFRAIEALGARPVLCDITRRGWVLDVEALQAAASSGALIGVRAVIVSHLHGDLAPMRQLTQLATEHGWLVVEDACQCPGATVDGRPAGDWGDASVLSFGGSKLLTAGRGGALLTSDEAVAQRAKIYASRGNDAFPLSELQAAVLLPQLAKLQQHNQRRRRNAQILIDALGGLPGLLPTGNASAADSPAHYKLAWRVQLERLRSNLDQVAAGLRAEGVPVGTGFKGFTSRSGRRCRKATDLQNARAAAQSALLMHHPVLLAEPKVMHELATAFHKVMRAVEG